MTDGNERNLIVTEEDSMKLYCEYNIMVVDDVRKERPETRIVAVKAESPTAAIEKLLQRVPPCTGLYLV